MDHLEKMKGHYLEKKKDQHLGRTREHHFKKMMRACYHGKMKTSHLEKSLRDSFLKRFGVIDSCMHRYKIMHTSK